MTGKTTPIGPKPIIARTKCKICESGDVSLLAQAIAVLQIKLERKKLECENFILSSGRICQRNVLKGVLHEQCACFSSCNHCVDLPVVVAVVINRPFPTSDIFNGVAE